MSRKRKGGSRNLPRNDKARQQQAELLARRSESLGEDGSARIEQIIAQQVWSGALPRPEDFARFNEVVPGAAERILTMAEAEQRHRIDLERQIVPGNMNAGRRGQWLGAAISVIALLLAAVTAMRGAPWQVSVALVGVPVLSVARSLVTALRNPEQE